MASIVDVVSRQEPTRPSGFGGTGAEGDGPWEIAERRQTTPDRLARRLRGDLDAIVLRALRKEPDERYGSAEVLAHDLARHLAGEPVEARKGARGYRFRTFLRRNRVALVVAAVVALSIVSGAGAAIWQAQIAGQERDRAEEALRESEEVTAFLMGLFSVSDPGDANLAEVTAEDLLSRGMLRVEALSSQPLVQGRLLRVIADVHVQLGQYERAVQLHRRSLATLAAELGPEHPEVAHAMNALGVALRNIAGYDEARSLHHEALRIQKAGLTPDDPAIATTLAHIAYIEFDLQRRAEIQEEILRIRGTSPEPDASRLLQDLMSLASTRRGLGQYEEAVALLRRAREVGFRALGPDDPEAATPLLHIGDILRGDLGRPEEAEPLFREALAVQEAARGPYDVILIHGLHSLGELLGMQGRHEEAEALLRRAIDLLSRALGPEHPRTVGSRLNLAAELGRQARHREAEALYRSVVDVWERTRGPRHPSVAVARISLASGLQRLGRFDEAEAEIEAALEIRAESLGERSLMIGLTLTALGDVVRRKGEVERARAIYEEGREILLEHLTPDHPQVRDVELRLESLDLGDIEGPSTAGPVF